jgi:hypothetical protein
VGGRRCSKDFILLLMSQTAYNDDLLVAASIILLPLQRICKRLDCDCRWAIIESCKTEEIYQTLLTNKKQGSLD